jgi:hypothetical protein
MGRCRSPLTPVFSPEIKFFRSLVIKILGMMVVLTTIIMWLAAPFYWGSLWKANHYTTS